METKSDVRWKISLKWILCVHIMSCLTKGLILFKDFIIDGLSIDGNQFTKISVWVLLFAAGTYLYLFPFRKSNELTILINNLFNIDAVRKFRGITLFVSISMLIATIVPVFYVVMMVFSNIDPITAYLEQNIENLSIFYQTIIVIFKIYDFWNFCYACRLACFLVFEIMFASYLAMIILVNKIDRKNYANISQSSQKLKQSFLEYRKIVIHTEMVNSCFKNSVALPYKTTAIIFAVLMGTVALNSGLRDSSNLSVFVMAVYAVVNLTLFLAVGYSIPGIVNAVSKNIKVGWSKIIARRVNRNVCSLKMLRELRQDAKANRDIRIYFGDLNYYERDTGVNILRFMIDSTIGLVLMM